MRKQKKSKKRHESSQSSSRRSDSQRRSSSSKSSRDKVKRKKSRHEKRQKHSKKNKSDVKQRKTQKVKERSRSYEKRQKSSKKQIKSQHNQIFNPSNLQTSVRKQNFETLIKEQLQQNHRNQSKMQENIIQKEESSKPQKQLPCFEPSGILLQFYNSREGVSLRFHQPPEGRQPDQQWRIYVFKGEQVLKPIQLTKSCYLIGKDDRVVDILTENPSISRQHCVIQFRLIQKRQTEGQYIEMVKPYVMDLESTNGTILNDEKLESGRYYELLHRDVLKFGFSQREYVIVKWDQSQQQEGQQQEQ